MSFASRIGLSAAEIENADDTGSIGVVGTQSMDTVRRSPIQKTIVEKQREIMMESVDCVYRIK